MQSPSQAFLAPADAQTKGGVEWPQLGRETPLGSSGQHSAACHKDGAVPCPNPSDMAHPSLLFDAAQHLGMFGCPALLTTSDSCPGSALAPCRGMGTLRGPSPLKRELIPPQFLFPTFLHFFYAFQFGSCTLVPQAAPCLESLPTPCMGDTDGGHRC